MKKFIFKLILTSVFCFVAINSIMYYFIKKYPEHFLANQEDYLIMKSVYKLVDLYPEKTNIIIGDSRGNASIIPDSLGNNYLNLAFPGSNFLEGFLSLKKRLSISKIDTLLLVYGHNMYENNPWTNIRTIPLNYISSNDLSELEKLEKKYNQMIDARNNQNIVSISYHQWLRRLKYSHLPIMYHKDFVSSYNTLKQNKSFNYDSLMKFGRGHFLFGKQDSSNLALFTPKNESYSPNKVNLSYYDSIVSYSKKYNFKIIIIVPPINYSTYKNINESLYYKSMDSFFVRKSALNRINYLPNNCFSDSVHVNKRGSEKFSSFIASKLKSKK